MIKPHGDRLVNREYIRKDPVFDHVIDIDWETYQDLENIATGVFSPLEGFMVREEYENVVEKGRLLSGRAWTIPILLHISKEDRKKTLISSMIGLSCKGQMAGEIFIEDIYSIDIEHYCRKVFGSTDKGHPGVKKVMSQSPDVAGGKIALYKKIEHPFSKYHLYPEETRYLFGKKGWKHIVAFQTRNVPHIGHEYVQKTALSMVDGLFINPLIGKKKRGDFKDQIVIDAYKELIDKYYPLERVVMSILSTQMRYAGPKEAIFHAIIRKNFGATHIIIGRDHAGVGKFYHPFAAHKIFDEYPDLIIEPVFFTSFFRCRSCRAISNDKTCPHDSSEHIDFSGTSIREAILKGSRPSEDVMRKEVSDVILKDREPFIK